MKLLKNIFVPFLVICILFLQHMPIYATTDDWHEVKGTYAKDDNSQYNNALLSLMYLDNDVVMFEFFIMEGSESEDTSKDFCLSGAFYVDDNGIGIYDNPKTGNVKITFDLSDSGVSVKQTGNLPFNVTGQYEFVEDYITVTQEAAIEILDQLSPAVTSFNQYNSDRKLVMSDETVDGWFYDIKAYLANTDTLFAEFYIAYDMSAVYRVDTDTPILIWGSAQPMLDSTYLADCESIYGVISDESENTANENESENESDDDLQEVDYVSIYPQKDAIAVGNSTQTIVTVPGMLEYTLNCKSSNPEIAKIDDKGLITAVSEGEALISGVINIDGSEKTIEFNVRSFDEKDTIAFNGGSSDEKTPIADTVDKGNSNVIWPVIVGGIIIVSIVFIILKKKKTQNKN